MKTVIDVEDALRAMREAVADRGEDYVYPNWQEGCYYATGGQPACLVGVALNKLGVSTETLELADQFGWGSKGYLSAINLHMNEVDGLSFTRRAAVAFNFAQGQQDSGNTWGEAVEAAEQIVKEES